ncbi:11945_t:CDS:10 [Funneliformis caledonium]|uniref:11945_t:CDS:1 n=1 Tax=Funneliformis caledonium TaxID=1117310 RepID=A0A9N9H8E1_9GLOM|nr:11945_t:CDS:10 [Funneliformis caledonium]
MIALRNFGTRFLNTRIIHNTTTIKLPQRAYNNNYGRYRYEEVARVAKPAPLWEASAAVDGVIKPLSLKDYISKYLVMIFYPMDWTFGKECDMHLNTEVVGISCDSPHSHIAQGGLGGIKIPLIADQTKKITRRYGCLYEENGFPFRGTFIIDDKGILRVAHVNDTQIGRSVDETLRLVEAIQFTNKHGEVCPVNWKSGDRTIVPDPTLSKDYFSKI